MSKFGLQAIERDAQNLRVQTVDVKGSSLPSLKIQRLAFYDNLKMSAKKLGPKFEWFK